MAKKKINLIVKGKVQRAGYRYFIEETAYKLEVTGYTENLSDDSVSIVAEGTEENLNKFIEKINIIEFPIIVNTIEKKYESYKGEFKHFTIKRKKEEENQEILDRADDAAKYMRKMNSNMEKMNCKMEETSDKIINQLSQKMEKTSGNIEKTNYNMKNMSGNMQKMSEQISQDINSLREDTNKNMKKMSGQISQDINSLREDTNKNFHNLDNKYGEFSEKLGEAVKYLRKIALKI